MSRNALSLTLSEIPMPRNASSITLMLVEPLFFLINASPVNLIDINPSHPVHFQNCTKIKINLKFLFSHFFVVP